LPAFLRSDRSQGLRSCGFCGGCDRGRGRCGGFGFRRSEALCISIDLHHLGARVIVIVAYFAAADIPSAGVVVLAVLAVILRVFHIGVVEGLDRHSLVLVFLAVAAVASQLFGHRLLVLRRCCGAALGSVCGKVFGGRGSVLQLGIELGI
jgi:hypothetical protein